MNVFDIGSSKGDDDENIIQKEWAKMLTVKDWLWTHCLITDFMEIFQNSDLSYKEASPPADDAGEPAPAPWLQHKPNPYV